MTQKLFRCRWGDAGGYRGSGLPNGGGVAAEKGQLVVGQALIHRDDDVLARLVYRKLDGLEHSNAAMHDSTIP